MEKNYVVTKANNLISASYNLTLQEQKLILTLASMVNPNDDDFKEYTFEIKKFIEILEIETQTKYTEIPKITKALMKKVFEIREGKDILQLAWISSAKYKNGEGKVLLKFDSSLKPYMLQLKELYTSYRLENILVLRSKYSLRVYELLKSNQFKKVWEISLEKFKYILGIKGESYKIYQNVKSRVILKAQSELVKKTDISFNFEEIKTGRKVVALKFFIRQNKREKANKESKKYINNIERFENNKNIMELNIFFNNEISLNNIEKILKVSNNNIDKIKRVYEYSKTQKIENLVGFMIKMVQGENFQEPLKLNNKKIHNFTQRDTDYSELENDLLGWSNDSVENYYSNNNYEYDTDIIKNLLDEQLKAIFSDLRYKTWVKPSVDNLKIEGRKIVFYFINKFMKDRFEREFESVVREIISGIDSTFYIEKELI